MTYLDTKQFIAEVKQWGVRSDSLHKVRVMEKGKFLHFRFYIPDTGEHIDTNIERERYFDSPLYLELSPISIGGVWSDTDSSMQKILMKLEEINAKSKFIPYWGKSLLRRQGPGGQGDGNPDPEQR